MRRTLRPKLSGTAFLIAVAVRPLVSSSSNPGVADGTDLFASSQTAGKSGASTPETFRQAQEEYSDVMNSSGLSSRSSVSLSDLSKRNTAEKLAEIQRDRRPRKAQQETTAEDVQQVVSAGRSFFSRFLPSSFSETEATREHRKMAFDPKRQDHTTGSASRWMELTTLFNAYGRGSQASAAAFTSQDPSIRPLDPSQSAAARYEINRPGAGNMATFTATIVASVLFAVAVIIIKAMDGGGKGSREQLFDQNVKSKLIEAKAAKNEVFLEEMDKKILSAKEELAVTEAAVEALISGKPRDGDGEDGKATVAATTTVE